MYLLMTLGSLGDFMPFLALGDRLRQRGHRVVIASNAGYAAMAQSMGLEFATIWQRSDQSLDGLIASDSARAWRIVREQMFVPAIQPAQACIRHHVSREPCTVLAAWTVLGARLERQQSRFPMSIFYLSPAATEQDEIQPGENRIGLFPQWFADMDGIEQPGFVMLDSASQPPLPAGVEEFLQQGSAPVIFTPGSFMRGADRFFRHAVAACEALGLRAIFLTPYAEQLPALPQTVRHERYLPLRHLAPRATALVHHGGIGTSAEALRAGTPQLAIPLFFDQPDNAMRLRALGVGDVLEPNALTPDSLAEKLQSLLASQAVKQKCRQIAASFDGDAIDRVCTWCEKLS